MLRIMKKLCLTLLVCVPFFCFSQEKKEVFFGGQVGILEARLYNEFNLSKSFSFQTSVGMMGGINNSDFYVTPKVEVSPKWNYSLKKRLKNNKNTRYNAANYLALSISYQPQWSTIKHYKYRNIERIAVVPTFGIKRNFSKHINYEFFMGVGYERFLNSKYWLEKEDVAVKIGMLIGVDF